MKASFEQSLRKAVRNRVPAFGGGVEVRVIGGERWSSLGLNGERCRLRIAFEGPGAVAAGSDILAGLDELEIDLPGFVLADLGLLTEARRDDHAYARLDLEALLIED